MTLGTIGPWQIMLLFGILGIVLPVIALIDILRSNFRGNDKIMWVLIVLLLNIIGSILYLTIGRRQRVSF